MDIVQAQKSEYEEIRQFYYSLIDAMEGAKYHPGWEKDIYPSQEYLKESIEKGQLYIGREDGTTACAMIANHECNEGYDKIEWPTKAAGEEVLVLHALGVHPYFARRGFAKCLVIKALEIAKEKGCKAIRLDVLEGNEPAEKLYEGLGFIKQETLKMFYEDTGWVNFELYEKVV